MCIKENMSTRAMFNINIHCLNFLLLPVVYHADMNTK